VTGPAFIYREQQQRNIPIASQLRRRRCAQSNGARALYLYAGGKDTLQLARGARELLMDRSKGAQLRYVPLEDKASHLHSVARIDEQALGVSREKHHRHLINDSGRRGVIF